MPRHKNIIIKEARRLRTLGKTYGEIQQALQIKIAKSTISYWCRGILLPSNYKERIVLLNRDSLNKARVIALEANKIKREKFMENLRQRNMLVAQDIQDTSVAKVALAMLCLGEASKYHPQRSFSLGSSDPRIVVIFLKLLKKCFNIKTEKVRCTVQCRADQDTEILKRYWKNVTGIPLQYFYKAQIDPRTKGKPTKKNDYKGVLRVDYLDVKVQLELESLADLIYNNLVKMGP